jgi:hypothetical protein
MIYGNKTTTLNSKGGRIKQTHKLLNIMQPYQTHKSPNIAKTILNF